MNKMLVPVVNIIYSDSFAAGNQDTDTEIPLVSICV